MDVEGSVCVFINEKTPASVKSCKKLYSQTKEALG